MAHTALIATNQLEAALGDPALVVVDCQFNLNDTGAGERAYRTAHVPGAVYVHLDRDLSAEKTGTTGRHPLPAPETAAATFSRLGIDRDVQVVAYDQDSGMYASRLWWMLRWLGHENAAVLDGGLARWVKEGRPTRPGWETRPPQHFVPVVHTEMLVTVKEMEEIVAGTRGERWRLIDGRAPERFRGEVEPIDRVAGHIPGAVNAPFLGNLTDQGVFRTAGDLASRYRDTIDGAAPDHVVCYCGSGVTACHTLLALAQAGIAGAKLYAGSWSEWSADPERPIERSPTP